MEKEGRTLGILMGEREGNGGKWDHIWSHPLHWTKSKPVCAHTMQRSERLPLLVRSWDLSYHPSASPHAKACHSTPSVQPTADQKSSLCPSRVRIIPSLVALLHMMDGQNFIELKGVTIALPSESFSYLPLAWTGNG